MLTEYQKFLIEELHRFVKKNNRNPMALDMRNVNGYPTHSDFRNSFNGKSFTEILEIAGLPKNKPTKKKRVICEICRDEFTLENTMGAPRKICYSKKCRYIRDHLLIIKAQKKKFPHSIFNYFPEDKLIEYYDNLYTFKKDNKNLLKVM